MKNIKTVFSELVQSVSRVLPALILCGAVVMPLGSGGDAFGWSRCPDGQQLVTRECPQWKLNAAVPICETFEEANPERDPNDGGPGEVAPEPVCYLYCADIPYGSRDRDRRERCEQDCREKWNKMVDGYYALTGCKCSPVKAIKIDGCNPPEHGSIESNSPCLYPPVELDGYDLMKGGVTPNSKLGLSKSRPGCEAENNLLCDRACDALATKEPETQEPQTRSCCVDPEPGQACVPGQMIDSVDPMTGLAIQTPCELQAIEDIS